MNRKIAIVLGTITALSVIFFLSLQTIFPNDEVGKEDDRDSTDRITKIDNRGGSTSRESETAREAEVIQPFVLSVADLEIPLLYEGDVSNDLKKFISNDLGVLFANARDYERYELNEIKPDENLSITIAGETFIMKERLFFLSSRLPDLLHENLGIVVSQNGVEKLLIPDVILDSYKDAFILTKKYSIEFEELGDFVSMMTDSTEDSPFNLHPKDVLYMPGSPVLARLEENPKLIPEAQKFYSKSTRIRMPSVLDFKEVPQEQQNDGIYLKAKGHLLEGEPETPSVEIGFVYHDGLWKLFGKDEM